MAHHQHTNYDRVLATRALSSNGCHEAAAASTTGGDDLIAEVDEPPDSTIQFTKIARPRPGSVDNLCGSEQNMVLRTSHERKESLLTQALLSSPELTPMSDAEAPVLTSDGGLTSPARTTTPSPPTPIIHPGGLERFGMERTSGAIVERAADHASTVPTTAIDRSQETVVEANLGRKRCISFACGRQSASPNLNEPLMKKSDIANSPIKALDPPKRSCLLRFACPMKPSRTESNNLQKAGKRDKSPSPIKHNSIDTDLKPDNIVLGHYARTHRDSTSTVRNSSSQGIANVSLAPQPRKGKIFNRIDFQNSEATRFHEFAGPFSTEDEWTQEQTAYRQKITVNDTLRKENAIRRLADEAEEEALEEEAEDCIAYEDHQDDELNDEDDEEHFDDGNETDDEEGFAESDDESDNDSDNHFWTPGLTTAATSTDHLEHIRPMSHRIFSDSSIESAINLNKNHSVRSFEGSSGKSRHLRPGTPDLPDSSDFVVGTIDEDRPLEEAYMSCLEERRRSRHKLIPQDIDPSFPTSDPELDVDEEDEEEDEEGGANGPRMNDESEWVVGRPETSRDGESSSKTQTPSSTKATRSPLPSPRRMHSPPKKRLHSPPPKLISSHRSPPPRRLFGQSAHRLRSPPPMQRKLRSPPSSRRPSFSGSPSSKPNNVNMPHLAQRPHLTHTTSLPRTPNPFWLQHRRYRHQDPDTPSAGTSPQNMAILRGASHNRGPIDIVQGLESKRQRRKDKFWRQNCRTAGRDKVRRCQPGKGAERMKELGLEMADRFRGYGQKAQLVLSV